MDFLRNNKYLKNILRLTSWSLISNAIVVFFTPLLTRIYNPSEYGDYSIYFGFLTLLALFSSGRFEFAIALPKSNKIAKAIFHLIIIIGLFFSFFIFTILLISFKFKLNLISDIFYVYILPVTIFLSALNSAYTYYSYRNKNYNLIGINSIIQSIINISANFFCFYLNIDHGLVIGFMIGQIFSVFIFHYIHNIHIYPININLVKIVFFRYIKFPQFNLPKDILTTLSQSFLPVILSFFFNKNLVGSYAIANRLLRMPTILIAASISNIFRNEAISNLHLGFDNRKLVTYTLKRLIIISLPFLLFFVFFSDFIFTFFLGSKWQLAGKISKIISIMIFFDFISMPFSSIYQIYGKHKVGMILEFINTSIGFLIIIFTYYIFKSIFATILAYSIMNSLISIVSIFIIYKISVYNKIY